jgi:hypothetical protein
MSAQELEDIAGAVDHLLLEWGGIEKFEAVIESDAMADDSAQDELCGVIGNQEFENHACSRFELSRQKEAHATSADVGSFSAKIQPFAVEEYSYAYGNHDRMSFPTPVFVLRILFGFRTHCLHAVFNVSHPVLSDNPTTVTRA